MNKILFAGLILLTVVFGCKKDKVQVCPPSDIQFTADEKIKGVSFDASIFQTTDTVFNPVIDVNAEWVAIIPFGYVNLQPSYNFFWSNQSGYWGLTDPGLEALAGFAKARGLKVMVKPQAQVNAGTIFSGNYDPQSESGWQTFENDYRSFILHYLQMANNVQADVFCIGTEWKTFVQKRPDFWNSLIAEVRSQFSGKITYASNWDEYAEVPFWESLDFIGVDAYFSINGSHTPTVEEMKAGWQQHLTTLGKFACSKGKQIVFTEYGYRSTHYCAQEPWNTQELFGPGHVNLEAQKNALEGFYEAVWKEEWFAGGFIWKWFAFHSFEGGPNDNRYTPQNKPAEETVRSYYSSL